MPEVLIVVRNRIGVYGRWADELSDRYEEAQAVNYGVAPIQFVVWYEDQIVQSSQAILPGARSLRQEGAGHFDWIHPGTDAFSRIGVLSSEL